jgi:hypothetical protein
VLLAEVLSGRLSHLIEKLFVVLVETVKDFGE